MVSRTFSISMYKYPSPLQKNLYFYIAFLCFVQTETFTFKNFPLRSFFFQKSPAHVLNMLELIKKFHSSFNPWNKIIVRKRKKTRRYFHGFHPKHEVPFSTFSSFARFATVTLCVLKNRATDVGQSSETLKCRVVCTPLIFEDKKKKAEERN